MSNINFLKYFLVVIVVVFFTGINTASVEKTDEFGIFEASADKFVDRELAVTVHVQLAEDLLGAIGRIVLGKLISQIKFEKKIFNVINTTKLK